MLAGDARLISFIRKVSSPYNVNGVALAVLPDAVADEAYLAWYVDQVRSGRERIFEALKDLGVRTWPSAANFVLMDIGPRHKELCTAMRGAASCFATAPPIPDATVMCASRLASRIM
jgi:histidinol-phosphate aminotransferase